MTAPENPPAFAAYAENCGQVGMTLRDWFAGQAISGMMAAPNTGRAFMDAAKKLGTSEDRAIARAAFLVADAMLAERGA